jgi:Mg2+/Co2+ transporter CorB
MSRPKLLLLDEPSLGLAPMIVLKIFEVIRDLNRDFDWQLPDTEAATVAGLVMQEARRIPEVGQIFTFHGFRFEILRRKRNQVTGLRVTPPTAAEPPDPSQPEAVS